ncbi:hypothetical protein Pelo_19391 [Pelomyxa schiedti]|nr:hypothetical protein Pelo_19391 [Pelomyxa schiedti]
MTVVTRVGGNFESPLVAAARRACEVAFLAAQHHRCGANSNVRTIGQDGMRMILEWLRPTTINSAFRRGNQ